LLRISITSEPRLLHVLRGVVRWVAAASGFCASDAERLAMAVDEAAANIIRHSYGHRTDNELALTAQVFPDRLELALEDQAPRVEGSKCKPRALEDLRPGGLGTYFINCFMDEVAYEDVPKGNRLRLVKYFPRKDSPAHEG
jgi:anti-sigma regulatory factor (Ser/Thr protein kinase)